MHKGSNLIGLRVIAQGIGGNAGDLGHVRDLVFDHEHNQVIALLLHERDLFGLKDAQVVPWREIVTIGPQAIVVHSQASRIKAGSDPHVRAVWERRTTLAGTQIYTTDGRALGTFADLVLDESGYVMGYEVSGGFISDTLHGKRFMPAADGLTLGEKIALVPPEAAAAMEAGPHRGGLQATTEEWGARMAGAYEVARSRAQETYTSLAGQSVEKQKAFVVGKVASRDVYLPVEEDLGVSDTEVLPSVAGTPTPDAAAAKDSAESAAQGDLLVRRGETIKAMHAEEAVAAGVLHQLMLSAIGGATEEVYFTNRDSATAASSGMLSSAQERALQAALGKPAGREVRAADGTLIAAPGTLITTEVIDNARFHEKETELLLAAGTGAAQQSAESIRQSATNLWDSIKNKTAAQDPPTDPPKPTD